MLQPSHPLPQTRRKRDHYPMNPSFCTVKLPLLTLGGANPLDVTGRGSLIPTTAVDQYAATLAQWFGVVPGSLAAVFPNIGNFTVQKLGFMG